MHVFAINSPLIKPKIYKLLEFKGEKCLIKRFFHKISHFFKFIFACQNKESGYHKIVITESVFLK